MKEVYFGIDPGSRTAGLAILTVVDDVLKQILTIPLNANVILGAEPTHQVPVAKIEYNVRINRLITYIDFYINKYQPNAIVIETPFISMGTASAFVPLYYFRIEFDKMLLSRYPHIGVIDKSPMAVKKHMRVSKKKKQGSKESMSDAVSSHPILGPMLPTSITNLNEHEIDAIAIALTGLEVPK